MNDGVKEWPLRKIFLDLQKESQTPSLNTRRFLLNNYLVYSAIMIIFAINYGTI